MTEENAIVIPEFDPDKHHPFWTDMIGQEYKAGDTIAYASANGRRTGELINA